MFKKIGIPIFAVLVFMVLLAPVQASDIVFVGNQSTMVPRAGSD